MLLNPTHEITFSGLPPDVLDAYVRYKKGTRAIVAWIAQFGPERYRGAKSLPLKELGKLASSISGSLRTLPDVIHFHFRETIAARKRLSKHFRGFVDDSLDNVDTVNHEHFTTSLTQIYEDLCTCCGNSSTSCRTITNDREGQPSAPNLRNHYASLAIQEPSNDEDHNLHRLPPSSSCEYPAVSSEPCCSNFTAGGLSDDDFGNTIELAAILQEVKDCCVTVRNCWDSAGKGELHYVTAAFISNAAYAAIVQLQKSAQDLDENICLSNLHPKYYSCGPDKRSNFDNSHKVLEQMQFTQQHLLRYVDGQQRSLISHCASCMKNPKEYIQPALGCNVTGQAKLLTALIDNIAHLVTPCNIIRNSSPVYADLGYFVSHPNEMNSTMRSTVGLHLLSESYKDYLASAPQPSMISKCRLTALKLAQQASGDIRHILKDGTCFPCRCPQTLAYHLHNLETDLSGYAKYKCWNVYFQSPWVAGNHILEILDLCHFYGTHLLNYRHYIGAVLHSYNVLQQLAGLEKIPLLEAMCNQMGDLFFPGRQRPSGSFRACWTRYIGARIKFKKGHKNRSHRDSWCMAVPAHAARKAAGLGLEGDLRDVKSSCSLFQIKQQDYHLSDAQWREYSHSGPSSKVRSTSPSSTDNAQTHQLARLIPTISTCLHGTDSDSLPPARLNHFAIFAACVRIVSGLSDATHTGNEEKGMNCICFTSIILLGGDRIAEAKKLGRVEPWKKDERECIDRAKTMMREVMGSIKAADWLWDI